MPSPELLDFAELLAPIADDMPAGADPRGDSSLDSPYQAVRDARAKARVAEKKLVLGGEDGDQPAPPDWRSVRQHGLRALAKKSKDLEVVAYLLEALVRLQGFAGLRDGFRLTRELVERYWDALYPLPDEDGLVGRVAPLAGLNGDEGEGTLLDPINRVPLTEATAVGTFTFADYHDAVELGKVSDEQLREGRLARGGVSLESLQRAVAESSPAFYQTLVEDLTECLEQFRQLNAALVERCGPDAPPASEVRTALQSCLDIVQAVARDKLQAATHEEAPPADAAAPAGTAPSAGEGGRVLRTREDAFRGLLEVAEFFRRTEPHTVISYTLEQVVRWGRMPLPALLAELIPEEGTRLALFKHVGIKHSEPAASGA